MFSIFRSSRVQLPVMSVYTCSVTKCRQEQHAASTAAFAVAVGLQGHIFAKKYDKLGSLHWRNNANTALSLLLYIVYLQPNKCAKRHILTLI